MSKTSKTVLHVVSFALGLSSLIPLLTRNQRPAAPVMDERTRQFVETDRMLNDVRDGAQVVTQCEALRLQISAKAAGHPREVGQADSLYALLQAAASHIDSLTNVLAGSLTSLDDPDTRKVAALMQPATTKAVQARLTALYDLAHKLTAQSGISPAMQAPLAKLAKAKQDKTWEKSAFKDLPPQAAITQMNDYKNAGGQVVQLVLTDILNRM